MKAKDTHFKSTYWWIFLILFLHVGAFSTCASGVRAHVAAYQHRRAHTTDERNDRDLSRRRLSDDGLFWVTIEPHTDDIPLNRLHAWTLHVETPEGGAVEGATITVDGGMPDHGHGLPTKPQVTQALGNGKYLVEGLKFQMPGWWVVQFSVSTPEGADVVSFNLML